MDPCCDLEKILYVPRWLGWVISPPHHRRDRSWCIVGTWQINSLDSWKWVCLTEQCAPCDTLLSQPLLFDRCSLLSIKDALLGTPWYLSLWTSTQQSTLVWQYISLTILSQTHEEPFTTSNALCKYNLTLYIKQIIISFQCPGNVFLSTFLYSFQNCVPTAPG